MATIASDWQAPEEVELEFGEDSFIIEIDPDDANIIVNAKFFSEK